TWRASRARSTTPSTPAANVPAKRSRIVGKRLAVVAARHRRIIGHLLVSGARNIAQWRAGARGRRKIRLDRGFRLLHRGLRQARGSRLRDELVGRRQVIRDFVAERGLLLRR